MRRSCLAAAFGVVLFVGDSLTAGYGLALESAFPALLDARWQKEARPWRARNAGVSGQTTAGVLETIDWTLTDDVSLMFLCAGANDGLRGMDLGATRRNLDAVVAKAQARGVKVVLAGMKLPPNYGAAYSARFEDVYKKVAKRRGVPLMDFLLRDVAGSRSLNLPDGIHPNEAGHRIMAENVHAFLLKEKLLR